jgi:ADP-heptose:LPS heptosyltransferase
MQDLSKTRRLAIVYPKAIGDFFFVLPALHTIRRAFREAHITLVVKQKQAPLAEPQKGILADEVLVIGGGTGLRDIRRKLDSLHVDTVVDMAGNDQSGLILSCRSGRRLRPHRLDCKGMCALYSPFAESMPRLPPGLHRVEELLSFAACLGAVEPVYSFRLHLPERAVEESEGMITRYDLRSGLVVAINLGASRETKRWPAEHIRTLTRALLARGLRVVLTGSPSFAADGFHDRRTMERFAAEGLVDGVSCVDLVTDNGLPPALHLQRDTHFLRYSGVPAVVVGSDTGPMHMAGSVGDDARNRTVSLFGPTNWGRYAPYDPSRHFPDNPSGAWNRVLCANVACGPVGTREACDCYRRGGADRRCMHALSPEMVLETVLAMGKA